MYTMERKTSSVNLAFLQSFEFYVLIIEEMTKTGVGFSSCLHLKRKTKITFGIQFVDFVLFESPVKHFIMIPKDGGEAELSKLSKPLFLREVKKNDF